MAGILDLLHSDLGKQIINGVSGSTGADEQKTGNILTMALPVLMKAMERNASTPEGAEGLMGALKNNHNGSILDNLGDLFNGGVNEEVTNDGDKILDHILGNKKEGVEKILGEKSGLESGSVQNILKVAAPILMGVLGKQVNENDVKSDAGLNGLLGGLLGGNTAGEEQNFLEKILDADGDGSVIDDVSNLVLGKAKESGGLGGLLGGLFGKK